MWRATDNQVALGQLDARDIWWRLEAALFCSQAHPSPFPQKLPEGFLVQAAATDRKTTRHLPSPVNGAPSGCISNLNTDARGQMGHTAGPSAQGSGEPRSP